MLSGEGRVGSSCQAQPSRVNTLRLIAFCIENKRIVTASLVPKPAQLLDDGLGTFRVELHALAVNQASKHFAEFIGNGLCEPPRESRSPN